MLSQMKMQLASIEIEFLGMHLKDGQHKPHEHLAKPLLRFPGKDFSKLQVHQFLGIVNYLRDFVPKIQSLLSPLQLMLKKNFPVGRSST